MSSKAVESGRNFTPSVVGTTKSITSGSCTNSWRPGWHCKFAYNNNYDDFTDITTLLHIPAPWRVIYKTSKHTTKHILTLYAAIYNTNQMCFEWIRTDYQTLSCTSMDYRNQSSLVPAPTNYVPTGVTVLFIINSRITTVYRCMVLFKTENTCACLVLMSAAEVSNFQLDTLQKTPRHLRTKAQQQPRDVTHSLFMALTLHRTKKNTPTI